MVENGAEKISKFAKFESSKWSNSTFPELNNVMIAANFELSLYQSLNLKFPLISKVNILKAKHVFIKNGKQTNRMLQI